MYRLQCRMHKRYKKGRPCCGQLLGEKILKQPFNVGALNAQRSVQ